MNKTLPNDFLDRLTIEIPSLSGQYKELFQHNAFRGLRINPKKAPPDVFIKDKPKINWCPIGYEITEKLGKHPYHHAGAFYLQEPSAMAVVELMEIQPSDVVLDCAAAPGGKSTHIAGYLGDEGYLWSHDVHRERANQLAFNLERMGFWNGIVTTGPLIGLSHLVETFDKVLVDAPCSGEGMFRKDEEAVRQWTSSLVQQCVHQQKTLLEIVAPLVKPGGYLVYSTCTFSKAENENQIKQFLEHHPEFSVDLPHWINQFNVDVTEGIGAKILPNEVRGEGHYLVRLIKNGDRRPTIFKAMQASLSKDGNALMKTMGVSIPEGVEWVKRGTTWSIRRHYLPVHKLQIIREGLLLGNAYPYGFVPDHALSHAIDVDLPMINFAVEDESVIRYLTGDVISVDVKDGWYVVSVSGMGLGWIKVVQKQGKNHYPKGLRQLNTYVNEN